MSTGLMHLDCFRITTELSAVCVFFLIESGDSVVLVTDCYFCHILLALYGILTDSLLP